VVFGLVSLRVFLWLWPWLSGEANGNHVNILVADPDIGGIEVFLFVMAVGAAAVAWARSWPDLAILGWLTLSMLLAHETFGWHVLTLSAWFLVPVAARSVNRVTLVRDVRILVIVFIELYVFHEQTLLVPHWISKVLHLG
jgi:hypothetical protein